jgi:hypothetical protein
MSRYILKILCAVLNFSVVANGRMADEDESPATQFVSVVVKPGDQTILSATDSMGLVLSNCCIPSISSSAPSLPSRLFVTLLSRPTERILLATLVPGRVESDMLAFRISPGERVRLEGRGPHDIHVIGYLQTLVEENGVDDEPEEDEEESG